MNLFGRDWNIKLFIYVRFLPALIIVDLFLITVSLIFQIPSDVLWNIQLFDLVVCIILLVEYFLNLIMSSPKKDYILDRENMLGLIASIPFDFILPWIFPVGLSVTFLRYLRIFKLIRVFNLFKFDVIKDLFRKTALDKILLVIVATILIFWALFYFFGPSYGSFDDFYFVIVTLTTVGYGDVTPKTHNEKVLVIILILIGIFIFSTVTAAISSFLTDRILKDEEDDIVNDLTKVIDEKSDNILAELEDVRLENKQLKTETNDLKAEIKELKDIIKNIKK